MKIVMLLPMGIDRPSGRRYFNLARNIVRAGHSVRLLALHPNLPRCPQRRFIRDGVEVWYVGQMHARKSSSVPGRFGAGALVRVLVAATLGMLWGIICSPADVYHLGKPQPVNGLAALIGVMLLRGRRFYVDCDDDEVGSNRLTAAWQRTIFAFWQWLLPRLARGVTVNTHWLEQRIQAAGLSVVVYVPNGVDPVAWQPPSPRVRDDWARALKLDGRRVVAYLGTVALHNHPVDLLLAAFDRVAARLPDVDLLVIGGGEDLPALRHSIGCRGLLPRVRLTGDVPYALLPVLLAMAQVSIDPVVDNPVARARSPLKVFESMALGVPVMTGDVGDRSELLAGGQAGVLVPPGNADALANALVDLLSDPDRRARLAAAAQRQSEHYRWSELAARWLMVYDPR